MCACVCVGVQKRGRGGGFTLGGRESNVLAGSGETPSILPPAPSMEGSAIPEIKLGHETNKITID